jgi:hypothetical protein
MDRLHVLDRRRMLDRMRVGSVARPDSRFGAADEGRRMTGRADERCRET